VLWSFGLPWKQDKLKRLLANEPVDPPPAVRPPKEPPLDLRAVCERAREYVREFEAQDRLFPLQGEVWYAGFSSDGRQMLVDFDRTHATVYWFDGDGRHLDTEVIPHNLGEYPGPYFQRDKYPRPQAFLIEQFGFRAGTIHIRRFPNRASAAAIQSGPWWLERFVLDPEWVKSRSPEYEAGCRQYEAKRVLGWVEMPHHYVLVLREPAVGSAIDINDGRCKGSV
jgi:hypothetical protein